MVPIKGLFSLIAPSSAHWTGSSNKLDELTWTLGKPDRAHIHSGGNFIDVWPFDYLG